VKIEMDKLPFKLPIKLPIGGPMAAAKLQTMTPNAPPTRLGASTASTGTMPAAKESLSGEERRRGQRVLLRVRAQIHVMQQGKPTTFDVTTLSVNPHGALVVMDQGLAAESLLVLEHTGTRQRIACKVVRPAKKMPEGYHVAIEFDSPAPDFWKIDFPPADWRADE
jgi:hypothetical protein